MWLNLVHAVRHVRRRPVLTAVGIASLAVGIGCALACASVVNAVLFRAFPYHESNRLVLVWENNAKRGVGLTPASILNYQDLKAGSTTFEELGAFTDVLLSLDGPDGSERVVAYKTSAGLIDQMRVAPLLGRVFTTTDDAPGAPAVAVLSHGMWRRRFGADPAIVGREMLLSGVKTTVIGVMPSGFLLPPIFAVRLVNTDLVIKEADVWIPLKARGLPQRRDARTLFVLGRLKAGATVETSQAEASTIARRLASDYAVDDLGLDFTVVPLEQQVLSSVRTLLVLLLLVGALVLIIAGANAAHLLLADALTMTGETSVRSALGATTWRLASGQGTLSVLWCALATAGALLVAAAIEVPVAAYTRANVPRLSDTRLDGTVGIVALTIGLALAFAISLLPVFYAAKTASVRSASAAAAPVGMPRWRRIFVVLPLAIAVVVLSTAALLYRSAGALDRINPGFAADGVSVFELMLPDSRYGSPARRVELQRRLLELVADVPGRQSAATVDYLPFSGANSIVNFTIEHQAVADAAAKPRAALRAVSESYFDVLSIPAVVTPGGRLFNASDESPDAATVIVNDAFVRRYADGGGLVGHRIKRGDATSSSPWMTVVGVVGSVRGAGLGSDPQPEVFIPYTRGGTRSTMNLIVRTPMAARTLAPAIVERLHRADAALSPTTVTDMAELVARASGQPHFYARLFGVLAVVAFALSLVGIYGVATLGVSARSEEIAIRACLGAQPGDIVRLVLGETAAAVLVAAAGGAWGAWVLQRRVASFVYGAASTDWSVIALSVLTLSALAMAVVYLAIRQASQRQPMDLLRHAAVRV